MKEIKKVRRVLHERDVAHIETAEGEKETLVDVESVHLTGATDVEASGGTTEGLFKGGKCVIVETTMGRKVIDCRSKKYFTEGKEDA